MTKVLLIQGPNLHYLGKREPSIYGHTTAAELDAMLLQHAADHGYQLEIFYTNIEGEAVNRIYQGLDEGVHGVVMNPAAFGFNGYALRDCIEATKLPYVEVHISNIAKRERESILAAVATGVVFGFGIDSYFLALQGILNLLKKQI